jgi:hypothetical protein
MGTNGAPIPEEVQGALVDDSSLHLFQTEEERAIAAKVIPVIQAAAEARAQKKAEATKAIELKAFMDELVAENRRVLDAKIEEYRKALTPPSAEEIQVMLDQEYVEYTLNLRVGGATRSFTIMELPMAAETRIVKAVRRTLAERLKEISSIDWQQGGTMLDRILKTAEIVPGVMETLSDCVAICLDPTRQSPDEITGEWVRDNLGSYRIAAVIQAQMEVGRYRDFFYLLSRLAPGTLPN